ncbi:MAG TPA: hypothetical protein V6D29_17885 [Leptolyngbyaceae cyanobacterium]
MTALARSKKQPSRRNGLWFERLMALLALTNLVLVVFDLSYVRFRDVYLRVSPEFTAWYGSTFKGMQPDRATTTYLETVSLLENQVAQAGLQSPEAQTLLLELQDQSIAIVDENPFETAGKSGTLERIKSLMRSRLDTESSKTAFRQFWSQSYLQQAGWTEEIAFFNQQIQPLIATNFYRGIAFDGGPLDWFWKIDSVFIAIFGVELLARSFYLSRRYKNVTWLDAILWRWYDLLLIVPFSAIRMPVLGLSRVIPILIRLNQAQLLDLEPIRNRVNRFLVSQVAIELTEVVVLRIIDQIQNLIRQGDVARALLESSRYRYIDLNGVNELQVISQRLGTVLIDDVLPQIKPQLDALLDHSLSLALDQAPGYRNLRQVPGLNIVSEQITRQIVEQTTENLYRAIGEAFKDERGAQLLQSLITKSGEALRVGVQQSEGTVGELEAMTIALLEEVKLNYVKRVATEDLEDLAEQRYRLYDVTQENLKSRN